MCIASVSVTHTHTKAEFHTSLKSNVPRYDFLLHNFPNEDASEEMSMEFISVPLNGRVGNMRINCSFCTNSFLTYTVGIGLDAKLQGQAVPPSIAGIIICITSHITVPDARTEEDLSGWVEGFCFSSMLIFTVEASVDVTIPNLDAASIDEGRARSK